MIGIFSRWRQFGRRYFWPHLLLGMVAASFGLPACAQTSEPASADTPVSSLFTGNVVRFDHLIRLQETARRPNFNVDYWHQHAIRTVIRHLSFSMTPPAQAENENAVPLAAQKLALIDSLQALLTSPAMPQITAEPQPAVLTTEPQLNTPAFWLSTIQGIRAGPSLLNC
ncbi:secA translation cis-regulator SecM [Pantoea sp. App145]|uniref:secA translation cis-regulator SecM n=1 Tax=Pantoea sp. App145 TaxID=3071567 RepID=UPI003A80651C